jgi:hypothetical protein
MDAKNVVDGGIGHRAHSVREALENMDITRPDAPRGFVKRIAEENGWTIDRAQRADREYRRFLVLAATTSEMVVPSRDVDAVWHEHLLHTRHYWDVTCGTIIGRPFHHDPGDGGGGDAAMHAAGYERTLELYERTFGEPAPPDVWPRACRCKERRAEAEAVLALPAWTMLAGLSPIAFLALPGVVGAMVGAALLALALIAGIAQSQAEKERERTTRRPAAHARPRPQGRPTIAKSSTGRSSTGGSSRSRQEEASRSSDDAAMAALWMNDGGTTTATHAAQTEYCDTGSSHSHSSTSSHSSHSCGGSSHSSCGGSSHSSCGGSSHSSCGSSSSSSSCGGSSCGGSSCGGGGCGGS